MQKIFSVLFIILLASTALSTSLTACAPAQPTPTPETPTPTASNSTGSAAAVSTPTEPPKPAKKYETRDASGKLLYVEDIYSHQIKSSYEITVPPATDSDWQDLNTRLGSGFSIAWDGTNTNGTIAGVEGLNINKNGEVIFNFNGKGPERYSIVNVKVQEINGVKRLLVAGYAWNGETKSWEVFNPGFPMESPEAQVGWFNEADVPNGNWLRWDQRAKQDLAINAGFVKPDGTADFQAFMADIFKNAYVPTEWIVLTNEQSNQDFDYDGKNDLMKFNRLWWKSDRPFPEKNVGGSFIMTHLKKSEVPVKSGLTFSLLIDSRTGEKNVIISSDILNGDAERTVTTAATLVDLKTFWTERKSDELFERLKAAFGLSKYSSWTEAYMIWPVTYVFPGASGYDLSPELNALGQSQGSEIEGMIHGATISPQISLRAVPGVLFGPNIVLQSLH